MKDRSIFIFAFLIILGTALFADEPAIIVPDELINDIHLVSVRRNEGRTVGESTSYTTLEIRSFPWNHRNLFPFVDMRYHGFGESGQNALNAGLGFRYLPSFTKAIWGANVYYDYRKSYHRTFNQVGVGIESLGKCLNFRFNAYLPVGCKSWLHSSKCCSNYSNGYFLNRKQYIDGLKGLDFEAEILAARICCRDIYFALGGYYYKRKTCGRNILGAEYRITVNPCRDWGFCLRATHDCHYKTRVQGEITFTIPLHTRGNACPCAIQFQPVRREEMIVLDKHEMYYWNW